MAMVDDDDDGSIVLNHRCLVLASEATRDPPDTLIEQLWEADVHGFDASIHSPSQRVGCMWPAQVDGTQHTQTCNAIARL